MSVLDGQMDNLEKIDRVPNAWIKQLCRVTKSMDEKIDEDVL